MSLTSARLGDLIHEAKDHLDWHHVSEVADAMHATGMFGPEVHTIAATVLALSRIMTQPEGDNVRTIISLNRNGN